MRLTITTGDSRIYVDGESYDGFDLSWIPTYNDIEVHAIQWYDDHGEIELKSSDPNIKITELGIFEQAIEHWNIKRQEIIDEQARIDEEKRTMEETMLLEAENFTVDDADIEKLLSQL